MRNPLDKIYITYPYGAPANWFPSGKHEGVDLRAEIHTPVYAVANGRVLRATIFEEDNSPYGTQIRILHERNSFLSLSAHLDELAVAEKDEVVEGQIIGYSGNTGNSTAPHLHFEIRVNGKFVNPLEFIKQHKKTKTMIQKAIEKNQKYLEDIANGTTAYFFDVGRAKPFRVKDNKKKYYNTPQEMWNDNITLGVTSEDADRINS